MSKFMMRQAQELQAKLARAQQELAATTLEATAGGGAVTVTINGAQEIQGIKIAPEVVNADDVEMLEDLVMAAVSEAMTKSRELAAESLGKLTGGLNIPGL